LTGLTGGKTQLLSVTAEFSQSADVQGRTAARISFFTGWTSEKSVVNIFYAHRGQARKIEKSIYLKKVRESRLTGIPVG